MDNVKINTSKTITLTLPSDPDSNHVTVDLIHEFGDTVISNTVATRTSTGVYSVTYGQNASGIFKLNSSGIHKASFSYAFSGTEYSQNKYFNVYVPYTDESSFLDEFPDLEDFLTLDFDIYESKIRNIINTYCGQSFDYFDNKSISLNGNNHTNLHLPIPIKSLKKVTFNPGEVDEEVIHDSSDSTINNIEKVRNNQSDSTYFIRYRSSSNELIKKFKTNCVYKIEGDYGWPYLPNNITQAANLLIADLISDDSAYRRHGIHSVDMDIIKWRTKDSFYETTGNIEADMLLMDYMMFIMDYVV